MMSYVFLSAKLSASRCYAWGASAIALVVSLFMVLSLFIVLSLFVKVPNALAQSPFVSAPAGSPVRFAVSSESRGMHLTLEVLDDDLLHVEYASQSTNALQQGIPVSLFVAKTEYSGAAGLEYTPHSAMKIDPSNSLQTSAPANTKDQSNPEIRTEEFTLQIDLATLCIMATDRIRQFEMTTICPKDLDSETKQLTLTRNDTTHVYGLGQQFMRHAETDNDWLGNVREGGKFGNILEKFKGGNVGNTQMPVLYAVGPEFQNYAFYLDDASVQTWDLNGRTWDVEFESDPIRMYLLTGKDLPDLRQDYMELVGHPLMPPKKMWGLWVSEFGYENWDELDYVHSGLRRLNFPIDGFVMDLQWFGGLGNREKEEPSSMGKLTWDREEFPEPEQKIQELHDRYGVGLMLIEESYINDSLTEHEHLREKNFLVLGCKDCDPVKMNTWWGRGGMVDWTNPNGAAHWHDWKRQPLIDMGVLGHWTDLGEPEYYGAGWYFGGKLHPEVHNLYNFAWLESIWRGYQRNQTQQRPFMMSRSGGPGMQRWGASLWSGDIGSNLGSLAAHANAQLHLSFSGIDYYGSDIGGFFRQSWMRKEVIDDLYTRWFAYSALFDVPVRPHAMNLCNCHDTSPALVGDVLSNRANIRLRYELMPYLYTLAHRAYRHAEPIFPPLVYYYQSDDNVRNLGHQKMIGQDMMAGIAVEKFTKDRRLYLPAGTWVDYHTGKAFPSDGEWSPYFKLYAEKRLRLPLLVRAGAIIPTRFIPIDEEDASPIQALAPPEEPLWVKIFAGAAPSEFTLLEDDGQSIAYQTGAVRSTVIHQREEGMTVTATIDPSTGNYRGAPDARNHMVEWIIPVAYNEREIEGYQATQVTFNGQPLTLFRVREDFDEAESGWHNTDDHRIIAKSGRVSIHETKVFEAVLEVVFPEDEDEDE